MLGVELSIQYQSCSDKRRVIERQSASLKCQKRRSLCSNDCGGLQTEHNVTVWSATCVKAFAVIMRGMSQHEIKEVRTTSRSTNAFKKAPLLTPMFQTSALWRHVATKSRPMTMVNIHIACYNCAYALTDQRTPFSTKRVDRIYLSVTRSSIPTTN